MLLHFSLNTVQLEMEYLKRNEILLIILLQITIAIKSMYRGKVSSSEKSCTKSDHFESDSDSDKEILVKPELFSMTEANLCSILIDRSNFPAIGNDETANFYAKTSIFGRENEPFAPFIDEHIQSELESIINSENEHKSRQAIVYEFCIRKANEGILWNKKKN